VIELSAGQLVADKYRIDAVIGVGGMGVVVSATHVELGQRVAIKVLREASPESVTRFKREARLIVRLKSAHIARVFDVGELDDDTPFIVMEYLEGEDFSRVLEKSGGRLPVEQAVDTLVEACEAVAEAHMLGVIHRDLKPANLFLARGPGGTSQVKVLDFGISKRIDEHLAEGTAGGLTCEGVALGSPGYMSPEQMTSSRDVDTRTDIFSFGAILYRFTGGQNPFKGDSLVSVLASMAMTPLTPLHHLAPGISDDFVAIVERCLAQNPVDRFATVADLALALAPHGSRRARATAEQIAATMGAGRPNRASEAVDAPPSPTSEAFGESLGGTTVAVVTPPPLSPIAPAALQPSPPALLDAGQPRPEPADQTPRPWLSGERRNLLFAFGAVMLLVGAMAWMITRTTAAPPLPSSEQRPTTATTTLPPTATILGASSPSPRPSDVAPKPPRPPVKPAHAPPHAHRPTADPSAPPSPTDMPGGRH
jgi:eukaryotic-like serine/threonine-protein kinase